MTLCLYECLKAVGLQRHYARFTSVGVDRAAHLSALAMEDYPLLGIRTMEDRTRLFHLVQLVKTLDLDSLGYDDGDDYDYDVDGSEEGYTVVNSRFYRDGCGNPDEDGSGAAMSKLNAATSARPPCIRRRLDFNETTDHQKLYSHPIGTVHVYASHHRNDEPVQGKGSAIPVQLELNSGSAVVCGCKMNKNYKPEVHSCPSNSNKGENMKPHITGGISMSNCDTRSPSRYVSFHNAKPSPATVALKTYSNKPFGHSDKKRKPRKQNFFTEMGSNGAIGHTAMPTPVYEAKRTAGYNYGLPLSSPPAPNKKQAGEQRISVCVRKRPLTRAESRRGEADVVTNPGGECVIVHESKEAVDLTQYILQHRFYFDQVFGEESSNEEVYRRTAYPLVQHMLNGGKATCFAYGQTGAGKTHTMLGSSPRRPGLYALAVRDIFAHLSTTHTYLLVYVSFFEIYCGQLYDLLDHRKRLFAREDGQKVVHISGLRDVRVDSVNSLLEVISQGTEERTQGMSGVNPLSSRSHALLQIQLRDPNQQIAGRMWFVDLAGSERASDAKEPARQSRMEGAEINQSLLALKECIRSLDKEQSHTPFRQSKLTQVLKDSFVGDSMTCMIANISPGHTATEHTLNTLRYADRVKELRGQGGLRGRRRGKTAASPKHNLSNNNSSSGSSVGTRGKSPPKKPKLGRQSEAFVPTTPTTRLSMGDAILCSTPKNSRCGEETNARGRKGIGLEHITPIGGWLGMGNKKHRSKRTGERDGRRIENERYGCTGSQSVSEQSTMAGLMLGRPINKQLHSWEVQKEGVAHEGNLSFTDRESGCYHRGKENQQHTLKGEREEERKWTELRRQVESRDTSSKVERLRESDYKKTDERNKERKKHLRRYHEQLQQFIPSSSSSSLHLYSPSTCPSFSSSAQGSLSSSLSPSSPRHSSNLSVSAQVYDGLEEVLDAYTARVEVRADGNRGQLPCPSGEIHLQTETSTIYNNSIDENAHSDCGGIGEDWRVSWEGTEAKFGQDRGESERRRLVEATGEARVRREDRRPAGMVGGERRRAWVSTAETEPANRMTGAIPTNLEAQLSYICDSEDSREVGVEGLNSTNVPADGVWSTEQGGAADNYSLESAHSNNDSNGLFSHPPFELSHQRAPAERPLSPACDHIDTLLTSDKLSDVSLESKHARCNANILPRPRQNTSEAVPSNSHREKGPWFAANASKRQFSHGQSTTSITQTGCKTPAEALNILSENPVHTQVHKHPDIKATKSVLPPDETYTDSPSYTMDPLSISLLQVDQQAATVSFLQGDHSDTSLCLENESGENNRREVEKQVLEKVEEEEDVEFCLSLLELPQAKTHHPTTSDATTATDHTERKQGVKIKISGTGRNNPHVREVMLDSLQDRENHQKPQTTPALGKKAPESTLKPSTCAPMQTSVMSPSFQHFGNTGSLSLLSLMTNATQMPPECGNEHRKSSSSIPTPQSESVSGQLNIVPTQCHTVHSNNSSNSDISPQPNNPMKSNGQKSTSDQQIRPTIPLFTLDDFDHDKWCIVEAHWEQLKEMEALCRKEEKLLCQQPDMAFGEYVHKLEEIMERKARCVQSIRAQLQPYLKPL